MRLFIIPILSIVVLSSCSVYRSGQTPDDVYYSPARQQQSAAYVEADGGRDDGRRYNNRDSYNGYDDYATADDRWLMMRVRNPYRWSLFDDYNYYNYSPYSGFGWGGGFRPGWSMGMGFGGLSMGYGFGGMYDPFGYSYYNHFNNYWNWNSYYNPYAPNIIVVNPKNNPAAFNRIRNFNLGSYNNNNYNGRGLNRQGSSFTPRYNNTNNSRVGNRDSYYNNNRVERRSYSTPSQDRPVRTYQPSNNSSYSPRSSGGSSGSSSGSGGGGGSRPARR